MNALISNVQLRVFVNAMLGAAIGVGIAMLIAREFFELGYVAKETPMGILPWVADKVFIDPREKGFYLLSIFLGIVCGWTAARCRPPISWRWPWIAFLGVILVFGLNALIAGTLYYMPLWIPIASLMGFAALTWWATQRHLPYDAYVPSLPDPAWRNRRPHLVILIGLLFLLMPRSFEAVAANIGFDHHIAPPVIAPALLFYAEKPVIPGIDFYQQYSVGMGWLFHFFLGNTAEQTLINYTVFFVTVLFLFHLALFYLLWWLYRSWSVAAIVSLMGVLMHFVTNRPFFAPSGSVLRYMMLVPAALVFLWWIRNPYEWRRALTMAFTVGASIFINTEIGIYTGAAVAAGFLFTRSWRWKNFFLLTAIGIGSLISFFLIMLAVYGTGILQLQFFYHLVEPLLMYGAAGFGGSPILWLTINWLPYYNIIAPGLAVATLAFALAQKKESIRGDARLPVLVFFAVVALLMSSKYINMSLVGVWHVNSFAFLIVTGWWCSYVLALLPETSLKIASRDFFSYRRSAATIMACVTLALSLTAADVRNPSDYVFQSWVHYPGPIQKIWQRRKCYKMACVQHLPHPDDVALIRKYTEPGEQVAMSDLYDWHYLMSAHRAPLSLYVPSGILFMQYQLDETVRRMLEKDRIFLPKGDDKTLGITQGNVADAIVPILKRDYYVAAEGASLVMWQRKQPRHPDKP